MRHKFKVLCPSGPTTVVADKLDITSTGALVFSRLEGGKLIGTEAYWALARVFAPGEWTQVLELLDNGDAPTLQN